MWSIFCRSLTEYFDVQVREVFKVKDIEEGKCRKMEIE
jgi:hypothetical protein